MPEKATDPLQAAAAHIDPVLFAEALAELDWTPRAELKELIDIIRDSDSVRHKMGAMQILRSRIIENLELSGAIQLIQERIRGQLPGGQYTAERSRYLSSDAASSTHKHLKTLSTERLDVSTAPSTQTEKPNDDDPAAGPSAGASRSSGRSDSRIRQDDLADDSQGDGPGPPQPDERHPTADTGGPPEPASGAGRDIPGSPGGPGHPEDPVATTPPAKGPEAEVPATGSKAEVPVVPEGPDAADAEAPFRLRKPESRPAFGRPLGRRTPTKPTIGGGICGPAETDSQ